jgi:hypothetical protein
LVKVAKDHAMLVDEIETTKKVNYEFILEDKSTKDVNTCADRLMVE